MSSNPTPISPGLALPSIDAIENTRRSLDRVAITNPSTEEVSDDELEEFVVEWNKRGSREEIDSWASSPRPVRRSGFGSHSLLISCTASMRSLRDAFPGG